MPEFKPDEPIETSEPNVLVEINSNEPLAPGRYAFELQVIDNDGNISAPANMTVVITDPGPTAVIDGPDSVSFGERFELSGKRSSDIQGGEIVSYIWTMHFVG